jgi:hypothetical protein
MLRKPIVLAVTGMIAGLGVAAAVFTFGFDGGDAHATGEAEVITVPGRIGPHIEVCERVFNLVSPTESPRHLKLRALIEFETTDQRWQHALTGCAAVPLATSRPPRARSCSRRRFATPLRSLLPDVRVVPVLFVEFIIQ